MKRLIAALVASMTCLAMVFGREPSYRKELPFTPKPIALNEPITCVPDTRVDIAFFRRSCSGEKFLGVLGRKGSDPASASYSGVGESPTILRKARVPSIWDAGKSSGRTPALFHDEEIGFR